MNDRYLLVKESDMAYLADRIRSKMGLGDEPMTWPQDFYNALTAIPYDYAQALKYALEGDKEAKVQQALVYENATDITDKRGVPAHSIEVFAKYGDKYAVARVIADNKAPGIGTHGAIESYAYDQKIRFSRPANYQQWSFVYVTIVLRERTNETEKNQISEDINNMVYAAVKDIPFGGEVNVQDIYNRLFNHYSDDNRCYVDRVEMTAPGMEQRIQTSWKLNWDECLYTYGDLGRQFVYVSFMDGWEDDRP